MSQLGPHNPVWIAEWIGWWQSVPVVLIVAGAVLLLAAIWRGQISGFVAKRANAATPTDPAIPAAAVRDVMRDSEELAALLAGQMDQKAARLERLIADADLRIRSLEQLSAEVRARRPLDRAGSAEPLNDRIYEMADEGMPPVEIARSLKQQTAKVQLILAMRRR